MSDQLTKQEIVFENGKRAQMIVAPERADVKEIVELLDLKPSALILNVGAAAGLAQLDELTKVRLVQLFSRGVARAAADAGALVIDGGTDVGTMALMGQGVADRGYRSPLLGVAPRGCVTYPGSPVQVVENSAPLDPNHSYFVLVESKTWGGESETLYAIAKEFASAGIPVVTLVVNGGDISKTDLLYSVRNGWRIIVVQGSGRLADEIASRWQKKGKGAAFIEDAVMAEIIADGKIELFSTSETPQELARQINWDLGIHTTLALAWGRFALYDHNSQSHRDSFKRQQKWILWLGIAATAFALTLTVLQARLKLLFWNGTIFDLPLALSGYDILHWIIVALPITISIFIAVSTRFNPGNKYILLRAAAERVKREIYTFRAHAGIYADAATRESLLQQRTELLGRELLQTEVKDSALSPYAGPLPPHMYGAVATDDGFGDLTAEQYVDVRLGDQIVFHRDRVRSLSRRLTIWQWLIYIIGGVGTFLAAVGLELWIALTTTLVGAITAYLQYSQTEYTMTRNTQTLIELQNVRGWWYALSEEERAKPENVSALVEATEKLLDDQLAGWVRQMSDAIAELRAAQAKKDEKQ